MSLYDHGKSQYFIGLLTTVGNVVRSIIGCKQVSYGINNSYVNQYVFPLKYWRSSSQVKYFAGENKLLSLLKRNKI